MSIWEYAALAVVALAGWYARSLVIRPWRACRPCEGSGKDYDLVYRRAFGDCPSCGGTGKVPRLGVRMFQASRYARLRKKGRRPEA